LHSFGFAAVKWTLFEERNLHHDFSFFFLSCLNVCRLVVLHPKGADWCVSQNHLQMALSILEDANAPFQDHLMCLRFICNAFKQMSLRHTLEALQMRVFFCPLFSVPHSAILFFFFLGFLCLWKSNEAF
jgi:hypothetical protein